MSRNKVSTEILEFPKGRPPIIYGPGGNVPRPPSLSTPLFFYNFVGMLRMPGNDRYMYVIVSLQRIGALRALTFLMTPILKVLKMLFDKLIKYRSDTLLKR